MCAGILMMVLGLTPWSRPPRAFVARDVLVRLEVARHGAGRAYLALSDSCVACDLSFVSQLSTSMMSQNVVDAVHTARSRFAKFVIEIAKALGLAQSLEQRLCIKINAQTQAGKRSPLFSMQVIHIRGAKTHVRNNCTPRTLRLHPCCRAPFRRI